MLNSTSRKGGLAYNHVCLPRNEMTEWNSVRGVNGGCKIPSLARLLSGSHLWNSHGLLLPVEDVHFGSQMMTQMVFDTKKVALLLESFSLFTKNPTKKKSSEVSRSVSFRIENVDTLTCLLTSITWQVCRLRKGISNQVLEALRLSTYNQSHLDGMQRT